MPDNSLQDNNEIRKEEEFELPENLQLDSGEESENVFPAT